jgi:glucosyl-dolichyl phosphate glucuronosyltransferase
MRQHAGGHSETFGGMASIVKSAVPSATERNDRCFIISIVILTYSDKRLPDIKELLASIEEQTYKYLELIFIVERSEQLYDFLGRYNSKYPIKIRYSSLKISVAEARNMATAIASGDVIAFVDDDAQLTTGWAERLKSSFLDHPDVIGITGRIVPKWEDHQDSNAFPQSLYWMIGCTAWNDSNVPHYVDSAQTLNTAYRRDVFQNYQFQIHQFKTDDRASLQQGLLGDDVDFALRVTSGLSRKLLYNPKLVVFHNVYHSRIGIAYVRRYAFWQGYTEARYLAIGAGISRKKTAYAPLLRNILFDCLSIRSGKWRNFRAKLTILLAASCFLIGYVNYRGLRFPSIQANVPKYIIG